MALCVVEGTGGALVTSGEFSEACTGYALMTAQEYNAAQWFPALTVEDGVAIGSAVFLAWAVAFGFRLLRKVVQSA